MHKTIRFIQGCATALVLTFGCVAMAQDANLKKAHEQFDAQDYEAAQQTAMSVDESKLSDAEKSDYQALMRDLPAAVNGARKAAQDQADADKAYEAGSWDEAERLYKTVADNKFAKAAAKTAASQQIERIGEKRRLADAAKPDGAVAASDETHAAQPAAAPSQAATEQAAASDQRMTIVDTQVQADRLLWERAYAKLQENSIKAKEAVAANNWEEARRLAEYGYQAIEAARVYADPASKYESARAMAIQVKNEVEDSYRAWAQLDAESKKNEVTQRVRARKELYEQRRAEQVEQLFNTARQLKQEQRFAEAAQALREIIFIEPANVRARDQLELMEDLESLATQADLDHDYKRNFQHTIMDTEETKVPWSSDVLYPKNWKELTARRGQTGSVTGSAEDRELNARLSDVVTNVRYDEVPLDSVIEQLQASKDVNIAVDWEDLANAGVPREKAVSLRMHDVPFKTVLNELMAQAGGDSILSYRVEDGRIRVATEEKLDRYKFVNVYDVRDLLVAIPRFLNSPNVNPASNDFGANGSSGTYTPGSGGTFSGTFFQNEDDNSDRGRTTGIGDPQITQALMDIIRSQIKTDSWRENGGDGSLRELNGNLIVYNTSEAHRQIGDLLGQLRETRALQVMIEARFLTVTNNFLEEIGVDLDFVLNQGSADFDAATNTGAGGVPSPLFDPFTGARVLLPRSFSQSGTLPATPPFGIPLNQTAGINQPYGVAGAVPTGTGVIPQFNDMTPIPIGQGSLPLVNPQNFNTGVPGSWAERVGLSPALNIAGSFLDNLQVDFLIRATQANSRSSIAQAPRLLLFNGQRANISVGRVQGYVASVRPQLAEGVVGFTPVPAAAFSGTVLDVEATIDAARKYVTVTVRANQLREPRFTRFEVQRASGNSPGVFITLLDQETASINTTVSIPDGGTVLMGGLKLVGEFEVEAGVPILSKIPVLKRAFTNSTLIKDVQTLLMLIKAKIIIQREAEEEAFPTLISETNAGSTAN